MEIEKSWNVFLKSGKVSDYLAFVNSCKEKEISEGCSHQIHNRGLGAKGNGHRGE